MKAVPPRPYIRLSVAVLAGILMLSVSIPARSKADAQDLIDLVRCIKRAVLFLVVARTDGKLVSGTGFVVTKDGRFVTSYHVVKGWRRIFVRMADGTRHEARVVAAFEEMDLAVGALTTKSQNYRRVALEKSSVEPQQGDEVLVFGYPAGQMLGVEDVTVTRGIVSALREPLIFQIDAAINPGNSGGPVVSIRNQVVTGVAFAQLPRFPGINFAVSIYAVRGSRLGLDDSDLLFWYPPLVPTPYPPIPGLPPDDPPGAWCKRND